MNVSGSLHSVWIVKRNKNKMQYFTILRRKQIMENEMKNEYCTLLCNYAHLHYTHDNMVKEVYEVCRWFHPKWNKIQIFLKLDHSIVRIQETDHCDQYDVPGEQVKFSKYKIKNFKRFRRFDEFIEFDNLRQIRRTRWSWMVQMNVTGQQNTVRDQQHLANSFVLNGEFAACSDR